MHFFTSSSRLEDILLLYPVYVSFEVMNALIIHAVKEKEGFSPKISTSLYLFMTRKLCVH